MHALVRSHWPAEWCANLNLLMLLNVTVMHACVRVYVSRCNKLTFQSFAVRSEYKTGLAAHISAREIRTQHPVGCVPANPNHHVRARIREIIRKNSLRTHTAALRARARRQPVRRPGANVLAKTTQFQ